MNVIVGHWGPVGPDPTFAPIIMVISPVFVICAGTLQKLGVLVSWPGEKRRRHMLSAEAHSVVPGHSGVFAQVLVSAGSCPLAGDMPWNEMTWSQLGVHGLVSISRVCLGHNN